MTPLYARMRDAADTLETVSRLYDAYMPSAYPWSAQDLRREALHVEAEEKEKGNQP